MTPFPKSKSIKHFKSSVFLLCCASCVLTSDKVLAQDSFKGLESLFTTPRQYTASFTTNKPLVDGDINESVWSNIPWTDEFTDIEGDKQVAPALNTRCKMIWDKDYLYIAAEIKEPHVWAYLKKHDEVVYNDNDFEIFIDPNHTTHKYFEIEVNAINTIFDLFLPKPYRNNTGPLISWDTPGMLHAVKVQGTLNDPSDKDKGWTVEIAVPYAALSLEDLPKIPVIGDVWRINFSRVEWDTEVVKGKYIRKKNADGKNLPEHNWVWSPQGVINMHFPERWGYLKFGDAEVSKQTAFEMPYPEHQRKYLWLVYYRQKEFMEKEGRYAGSLEELNIPAQFELEGKKNILELEAGNHQFYLSVKADQQQTLTINEDGLVQTIK